MNYLPLTKYHIVNRVWAISTLIITSCCTCHNYVCNLFLNGILAGASMTFFLVIIVIIIIIIIIVDVVIIFSCNISGKIPFNLHYRLSKCLIDFNSVAVISGMYALSGVETVSKLFYLLFWKELYPFTDVPWCAYKQTEVHVTEVCKASWKSTI